MNTQLFNVRVGQILVRQDKHTSLTLDFIKILDKYDMDVLLENYLMDGYFSGQIFIEKNSKSVNRHFWREQLETTRN
jgi:hypothetical protein